MKSFTKVQGETDKEFLSTLFESVPKSSLSVKKSTALLKMSRKRRRIFY